MNIGQPERATQNRVVALFRDELGYRTLAQVCQLWAHFPISSAARPHGCWGSLQK